MVTLGLMSSCAFTLDFDELQKGEQQQALGIPLDELGGALGQKPFVRAQRSALATEPCTQAFATRVVQKLFAQGLSRACWPRSSSPFRQADWTTNPRKLPLVSPPWPATSAVAELAFELPFPPLATKCFSGSEALGSAAPTRRNAGRTSIAHWTSQGRRGAAERAQLPWTTARRVGPTFQCKTLSTCIGVTQTTAGKCVALAKKSETCNMQTQPCGADLLCSNNKCFSVSSVYAGTELNGCTKASELCSAGLHCDKGPQTCIPPLATSQEKCSELIYPDACPKGTYCSVESCILLPVSGQACLPDGDVTQARGLPRCAPGFRCGASGNCIEPQPRNGACSSDFDCVSGFCAPGSKTCQPPGCVGPAGLDC